MADVWNSEGKRGCWAPQFSRPFNDSEMESVECFLMKLQTKRMHRDVEDRVIWTTLSRNFSVKSLNSVLEPGDSIIPKKHHLEILCTPKVTFFAWEATWGKALILDQVQRRGYSLANRCFFCHSEEEVDHILLYYVQRRDFFGNFCFLSLR